MSFAFENAPVYQLSLRWASEVESLCLRLKSELSFSTSDQLRRASLSIPLNIAEGYGRWHKGDKQQFYRIARGSVYERVPILQMLKLRKIISEEDYQPHYDTLDELAKMLTGLIKSQESP